MKMRFSDRGRRIRKRTRQDALLKESDCPKLFFFITLTQNQLGYICASLCEVWETSSFLLSLTIFRRKRRRGKKKKTYKTNTTVCHVTKATGFLFWSALDCVYKLLPTAKSFWRAKSVWSVRNQCEYRSCVSSSLKHIRTQNRKRIPKRENKNPSQNWPNWFREKLRFTGNHGPLLFRRFL